MIKFYKIGEVVEAFAVSERTVQRWISAGKLRAVRIGATVRIPADAIAEFQANHSTVKTA
ncbi:helix-turn-helix domain-containing protein [Planctomycetes bacterium TBK1r]|uniref:helix-turn-helix domain-containing protein n=1 Tax=Stieleria magnilauensis TaxID=2527963 RepID=UPI00119F01D8